MGIHSDETRTRALRMLELGVLTIDDEGRVWRTAIERRGEWLPVEPRRAESAGGGGYLRVVLALPGRRTGSVQAHRLVWEWLVGPIPVELQMNHRDLDKHNNRLSNLETVTASANVRHSYEANPNRGRPWSQTSVWRGRQRITAAQIDALVARRRAGALLRELAADFGISVAHVSRICTTR